MKKVRNYLSEVLEMKSNEVWLSFEEKCEFLGVGVAECKKTRILKIDISSPLKTFFFCILQVSTRKLVASLLAKCANAQGRIS